MTLSRLALYCFGIEVSISAGCAAGPGAKPLPEFMKGFLLPGAGSGAAGGAAAKASCCCGAWVASCVWYDAGASCG